MAGSGTTTALHFVFVCNKQRVTRMYYASYDTVISQQTTIMCAQMVYVVRPHDGDYDVLI
jgi:uncharacterized membrane protein YkvA (DUF1232 family)